jgi:YggT family protein
MMGGSYFANAGTFLIETIFGLFILAVLLRFLFQLVRADFYNPICQFVVKLTNPLLRPLRRLIAGVRGVDVAAIVLMLGLQAAEYWLLGLMSGYTPGLGGLVVVSIADLLQLLVYVFVVAILAGVVLSWVAPDAYNPAVSLIHSLSEPALRPFRRLVPPMGGLDLSPMVALIVLQLVLMLLVKPLLDLGYSLL